MNIAFVVEGLTELKLYPTWIAHLSSTPLTRCVSGYQDVTDNQFTIFNVGGIGKMRNEIPRAIDGIIANDVFDYLVIIVDGDNEGVLSRKLLIQSIINAPTTPKLPSKCQLKIIVQNVCIETWFTGHTDHFLTAKTCNDRGILRLLNEYDVESNDPELMPKTSHISIGAYHKNYLQKMLKGAIALNYKEATAHTLIDIPYFQRLEQRLTETPTHLDSFSDMITFLKSL
jgi:hypothetical protein